MPGSEWSDLLTEGNQLFEYLCRHYSDLFDQHGNIKDFDITPVSPIMMGYYEKVNEQYGKEIHTLIIPWIHEEYRSRRLTNSELWKPFRVPWDHNTMYYGYRKLFLFDKYYFQLTLVNDRDEINGILTKWVHFEAALYGWKNEGIDTLQPLNKVCVLADMMMPEENWIWK
jgi:hypothetical protein